MGLVAHVLAVLGASALAGCTAADWDAFGRSSSRTDAPVSPRPPSAAGWTPRREPPPAPPPVRYRITINGATVLHFKPDSRTPWDGNRILAGVIDEVAGLASFVADPEALARQVSMYGARAAQSASEPPDCYVLLNLDGGRSGSRDEACMDTFTPTWNASLSVLVAQHDPRILRIQVMDRDLAEDDPVGAAEVPLATLVQRIGTFRPRFLTPNGELTAGGLLTLTVTVERE